jgi:hypothetical protein
MFVDILLPPFNKRTYSCPEKVALPPLQPFSSKDETRYNLIMQIQDCRVNAATLSIQIL